MKNTTAFGTLVIVAAVAAGLFTAGPAALRLSTAAPNLDVDKDLDGVPDPLETELCDRAITASAVHAGQVGRCKSAKDWVPPNTAQRVFLPTKITPGPDGDHDALPAWILLDGQTLVVDPFSAKRVALEAAASKTVDVDRGATGDDANKDKPAPSVVRLPIAVPLGVEELRDGDRDDLPSSLQIKMVYLTVDRTQKSPMLEDAPDVTVPVDAQDDDASKPVQSTVALSYVPMNVFHDGDKDNDLVPHALTIEYVNVTVDRRVAGGFKSADRITLAPGRLTQILDADDVARDNVVGWSIIDKDADFVPDAVEPVFCQIEKESDPEDGSCDALDKDYRAVLEAKNPWNMDRAG